MRLNGSTIGASMMTLVLGVGYGMARADQLLMEDGRILTTARTMAAVLLDKDPQLNDPAHQRVRRHLQATNRQQGSWSRIS